MLMGDDRMVLGVGINDMPRGWLNNEHNKRIYETWRGMLQRCYNKDYQAKCKTYKGCSVCNKWLKLSGFVEDLPLIEGYEYWLKHPNERIALDKDIKSNGNNKEYCLEQCKFVSNSENVKQANKTRDYKNMEGDNNQGAKALSKRIIAINIQTKEIFIFNSTREAERELSQKYNIKFNHTSISQVCRYNKGELTKEGWSITQHRGFNFFFEQDYKGEFK